MYRKLALLYYYSQIARKILIPDRSSSVVRKISLQLIVHTFFLFMWMLRNNTLNPTIYLTFTRHTCLLFAPLPSVSVHFQHCLKHTCEENKTNHLWVHEHIHSFLWDYSSYCRIHVWDVSYRHWEYRKECANISIGTLHAAFLLCWKTSCQILNIPYWIDAVWMNLSIVMIILTFLPNILAHS